MYSEAKKVGVIDTGGSARGFAALGLRVFPAETAEEAAKLLHRLAQEDYAVIYLAEHLAQDMAQEIALYQDRVTPAVILIPGSAGSRGIGMRALESAVERAVGANILDT